MSQHRTLIRFFLPLLLAGVSATLALAAATDGRVSGTVADAGTGAPLPFANITILETRLGAASADDGTYFVLSVPAGTYTVQASVPGYKTLEIQNVLVTPGFTTTVNFNLEQTVAAVLEPVRVEATRPMIQRDATSTVRILDSEDYERLPTRGYQEAAAVQAGVVSSQGNTALNIQGNETTNNPVLFIRGGRANEVAYYVDGFSQQDPLTGYSTTSINTHAVDQVVVLTGGFNAEYGRIMSGAVNVVTKEGRADYFGTLEAVTDNVGGDWVGADKYDYNLYGASLGGPVLPGREDLTFFVSGERRWQGDRSPRSMADGKLPYNSLSGWTWQGKLNWRATPTLTMRGGTLGSADDWREYLHQYRFVAEHMPKYEDRNQSYFVSGTYQLKKNSFLNLGANFFQTERIRGDGVFFEDLKRYGRIMENEDGGLDTLSNRAMDDYSLFWSGPTDTHPGRVWDDFMKRNSSYWGIQGDWTHAWTEHNTLKLGGDFQRHTLRLYNHLFPTQAVYGLDGPGYNDVVNYGYDQTGVSEIDGDEGRFEDGAKHPISASLYAQNKYEFGEFVVNAGLRYDHLNAKTPAIGNEDNPFQGDDRLDEGDLREAEGQDKLSPRLGIGFPVSERTVFHANYGRFYQQPNLENLYTSYRFIEYMVRNFPYYFAFGNPNLTPETTTAYEVGFTQAVSPKVRLDITAYYKDVQDLVQVLNIPSSPRNFASYRNTDYGTIKGVDLNLQLLDSRGISGSLTYSLAYATGTGSISDTQRDIAWTGSETPKMTAPLAFDQRHKVVLNADFRTGPEQGPKVGGVFPFERMGLNLLYNIGSGFPYTPVVTENEVTLASISQTPTGPINSRYGPWTSNLDAKLTRAFQVGGTNLEASIWVLNVLDSENELVVYAGSGTARTTGWLATEDGRAWARDNGEEAVALYRTKELNPLQFGSPRQVRFGLRTSF